MITPVTTIQLGPQLKLPLEAVTEVFGFLGRRGQGKSYAAMKMAEGFHQAGAQFVALDPVGIWYGLRLAANGRGSGIPIPVFGGLNGDIPVEPTGGKLLADVIADRGISAVVDLSQIESDRGKAQFARDFAARFYFRRKQAPAAVHLFLEEAQEFIPQNPVRDEALMLHAFQRIAKLGRNCGIGLSLITQRPQEVHKKVLNLAEVLLVFQLVGVHERKAVREWIRDKDIDVDVDQLLPKLERGRPHVWSPVWLKLSQAMAIGTRWTFDASATPAVGKTAARRELGAIDLAQLQKDMAATVERTKQEDPRELRRQLGERDRRIRELDALCSKNATAMAEPKPPQRVEVPVLKDAQIARLEKSVERIATTGRMLVELGKDVLEGLTHAARNGGGGHHGKIAPLPMSRPVSRPTPTLRTTSTPAVRPVVRGSVVLRKGARRMLDALARRHPVPTTAPQVAQLAGLARKGGTFGTYLSDLRRAGYIAEQGDLLELTEAGWAAIGQAPGVLSPQTTDEVLALYRGVLRAGARRMIDALMACYPEAISRDDLGAQAEVALTGGTFGTYLSDLRRAGLVVEEAGGIRASEVLMDPAAGGART